MRNFGFGILVVAIIAGGLLVGWHADRAIALLNPSRAAPANARSERPPYDFDIDTTMVRGPAQTLPPEYSRMLLRRPNRPCAMPPPGDEAQVVLFGAYEGQAVSTASVAGMDRVTYAIDVEIEPGDTPLYLVMTSFEPMIWRFSGATQRITHVALSTQGRSAAGLPYAGATGLRRDQVGYATGIGCMGYFSDPGSFDAQRAAADVKRYTGRTPAVVGGRYALAAVRLPSGQGAQIGTRGLRSRVLTPKGYDVAQWRRIAVAFAPNGLATVAPNEVISAQRAETYDVLPGRAGLAQLVRDGSLRADSPEHFTILKPISRYPAGLYGGHAVTFQLSEGVPRPLGSPGHSCVFGHGATHGSGPIC